MSKRQFSALGYYSSASPDKKAAITIPTEDLESGSQGACRKSRILPPFFSLWRRREEALVDAERLSALPPPQWSPRTYLHMYVYVLYVGGTSTIMTAEIQPNSWYVNLDSLDNQPGCFFQISRASGFLP